MLELGLKAIDAWPEYARSDRPAELFGADPYFKSEIFTAWPGIANVWHVLPLCCGKLSKIHLRTYGQNMPSV